MKVTSPYKCDYCDRLKTETNHWWLRYKDSGGFLLHVWLPKDAALDYVEHICSETLRGKSLIEVDGSI